MADPAPGKIEADKAGWFVRDYFPSGIAPMSKILFDAAGSGVGIDFAASAFTDGILIDGVCGDAIHISGANTVSAVHISGDQATAILVDVDASVAKGLAFAVDAGKTMTTGIDMTCTGTGTITTALSLTYTNDATECIAITLATGKVIGTGMSLSGAGTYTTGILLDATAITTGISISAGSLTDAIKISGTTPADGIEISSSCGSHAINISSGQTGAGITLASTCGTYGLNIAGACSTAGIFLSATNKISFHDANIYMRASADGHFEIVSDDTITLSASGHGGIVFGGETDYGVSGTAGHYIDGTGWDWVTQTVGYVSSGALDAACAASYNCLAVTAATHSTASSFFGTWTELYVSDSDVLTNAANFAAVWGQVELGSTVTSTDSGDFMAAVYGNFKAGATFTNVTKVCGFLANTEITVSGYNGAGRTSAFECLAGSGRDWDYGLYLANMTTGVSVGACTTGINFSGVAATMGISMLSQTAGLFQGTSTMTLNSAHRNAFEINAISPANAAFELRGLYVTTYPSTAEQVTSKMRGIHSEVKSLLNIDNMTAVYGYANLAAAKTIASGSAALHGDVNVDFATTLSAGRLAAVWAQVRGDSALGGNLDCVYVDAEMDVNNAIYINVDSAKTATTGIALAGSGAYTTGISMTGATQLGVSVTMAALTVGDSYSGVRVAVTGAAPSNAYGMAGYFDTTITGTTAGHCYGLGSWINTSTTPVLTAGHIIVPLECGVYTGEAQTTARIVLGQFQAVLNGAPDTLHVFRVNTSHTITALFATGNHGSVGYAGSALTNSTKCGDIPIADVSSQGVVYVRCYDSAG